MQNKRLQCCNARIEPAEQTEKRRNGEHAHRTMFTARIPRISSILSGGLIGFPFTQLGSVQISPEARKHLNTINNLILRVTLS